MNKLFTLLTNVSADAQNPWLYIGIQISMWIAVASQIFLLVPDLIFVIKTKNTRENKWFKWIVWFVCSASWIIYSILLTWQNIPIEEVVGLVISESINLICLFIIYGIKIHNIRIAKRIGYTEKQWCSLQQALFVAKKSLSKDIKKSLYKSCKTLTLDQKVKLYVNVIKKYKVGNKLKRTIKKTANKVATKIIKKAENKTKV